MSRHNSLLWSFGRGDEPGGYLFGTMHVRDERAFRHVESVRGYMGECSVYAAEMNLSEVDTVLFQEAAKLPDNHSVRTYLTEQQYLRMRRSLLRSFAIDLDHWIYKHPFLISSVISEMILQREQTLALDEYLWEEADNLGMSLHGLESFQAQLDIMQNMPVRDHIRNLRALSRNTARFRNQIRRLVRYYLDQDIRKIYQSSKRQLGKLRKMMLYNRNQIMADRIVELSSNGRLFTAFGAAHLGGQKGVLALLRKKDYQVKPVLLYNP